MLWKDPKAEAVEEGDVRQLEQMCNLWVRLAGNHFSQQRVTACDGRSSGKGAGAAPGVLVG